MHQRDREAVREWGVSELSLPDRFVALLARLANRAWKLDQIDQLPRHYDRLVLVHQRGYEELKERLQGFVRYIPKGVDLAVADAYRPRSDEAPKQSLRLEMLFMGLIYHRKGAFDLIAAFHQVRRILTDVRLTIIGSGAGTARYFAAGIRNSLSNCNWQIASQF